MTAHRRLLACAVLAAACTPTAIAGAAGPPLPSSATGKAGAVAPGGSERLLALRAGTGTLVRAVRRSDGGTLRSARIAGRWTVPAVTINGGTTGLSADGRTLVLARPTRTFPSRQTRLAVLDAQRLAVTRRITLPGFFTVDAISPDGRWLYLIQYGYDSIVDYRVRALDTGTGRLAAQDVVDPREPGEQMGGLPMTRVMSRDGRWAYTLYGGGNETFIHALDTVGRTAACIDLDMLAPDSDLLASRLRLSADGGRLSVSDGVRVVATVDTRTFAVSEPGHAATKQRPRAAAAASAGGGPPWLVIALAAGGAGVALSALGQRRLRQRGRAARPARLQHRHGR